MFCDKRGEFRMKPTFSVYVAEVVCIVDQTEVRHVFMFRVIKSKVIICPSSVSLCDGLCLVMLSVIFHSEF
jgi:hypothetical protein